MAESLFVAGSAEVLADLERAVLISVELKNVGVESEVERLQLKERVTTFLSEFERGKGAWRYGLELYFKSSNEYARFYGLSKVVDILSDTERYNAQLTKKDQLDLRMAIIECMQSYGQVKSHFRNKFAIAMARLIKLEFPVTWKEPFKDLLTNANKSKEGAELLLNVLHFITEEVVEFQDNRPATESKRNSAIKDAMRGNVMQEICAFWLQILHNHQNQEIGLVHECMSIMREYVSWIDVNLIANESFIPVLYGLLANKNLRVHSLKILIALVGKGMEPALKVELIQRLDICRVLVEACKADNALHPHNKSMENGNGPEEDDDEEEEEQGWGFRENIAVVVNEIGLRLIEARNSLSFDDVQLQRSILEMLQRVVIPLALSECLDHEDQDAQEAVFGFVNKMLSVVKENHEVCLHQHNNVLAVRHPKTAVRTDPETEILFRGILSDILPIISRQMMYPRNHKFDSNDEDEVDFEMHRNELRKIFVNISRTAAVDAVLPFLLHVVHAGLNPDTIRSCSVREIEVLLTLMYAFGEGAPAGVVSSTSRTLLDMAKLGNARSSKKKQDELVEKPNDEGKAAAEDVRRAHAKRQFADLVAFVHRTELWRHPDTSIVFVFNETATRYASTLADFHPSLLPVYLQAMIGEGGITHESRKVRSHACYLIQRAVKVVGAVQMAPFIDDILRVLEGKLSIPYDAVLADFLAEEDAEACPGAYEFLTQGKSPPRPYYSMSDIENLHELAGVLIGMSQSHILESLTSVLGPVQAQLEKVIDKINAAKQDPLTNPLHLKILGNWAMQCVLAMGHVSKGVSPSGKNSREAIQDLFKCSLESALRGVASLPEHAKLRSSLVTMLHIVVRTMDESAIAFVPSIALRLLEKSNSLHHLLEALQLINQLLQRYKEALLNALDPLFLPIIRHIADTLRQIPNPFERMQVPAPRGLTSEQSEYRSVERGLMLFLKGIVTNQLDAVLYSSMNKSHLSSVFAIVSDAIGNFPDAGATQKHACKVFMSLGELWLTGGKQSVKSSVPEDAQQILATTLITQVIPASLKGMTLNFDRDDWECVSLVTDVAKLHILLARIPTQAFREQMPRNLCAILGMDHNAAVSLTNLFLRANTKLADVKAEYIKFLSPA